MSEAEKIKEVPKPPPEQAKEPSVPKTSQSAFDKVLEQSKILQQSPLLQGKVSEQAGSEYRVKEISKQQDKSEEKQKKDDRDETSGREKTKQKQKGSETVTKEAITRSGEKKGFGGGAGGEGGGRGGFGGHSAKKQVLEKKFADVKGFLNALGRSAFAGKLAAASASTAALKPQQMQALVNHIVQAIRVGKNELGEQELLLVLRENMFRGLRLRFTSKGGKVSVQFVTANREIKNLFAAESPKIKAALEEKGVNVAEIKVS